MERQPDRQTNSFIEISIEAGILLGGNGVLHDVRGVERAGSAKWRGNGRMDGGAKGWIETQFERKRARRGERDASPLTWSGGARRKLKERLSQVEILENMTDCPPHWRRDWPRPYTYTTLRL